MKNKRKGMKLISLWLSQEDWEHLENKLKNYPLGEVDLTIIGIMMCNAYKEGNVEKK